MAIREPLLLVLAPLTWVCGAEILVPTIVHRPPAQLGAILGSAFVLRFAVSVGALLLTWAGIAAGFTDPLVGAMLAGLAVTLVFREPFVGVINAWLQSMTYSKPQLLTSMTTAIAKAALVWLLVRAAATPARFGWLWALEAAVIGRRCWCITSGVTAASSRGASSDRYSGNSRPPARCSGSA